MRPSVHQSVRLSYIHCTIDQELIKNLEVAAAKATAAKTAMSESQRGIESLRVSMAQEQRTMMEQQQQLTAKSIDTGKDVQKSNMTEMMGLAKCALNAMVAVHGPVQARQQQALHAQQQAAPQQRPPQHPQLTAADTGFDRPRLTHNG